MRKAKLLKIFNDLKILYTDLNHLILDYDRTEWETTACKTWYLNNTPYGINKYQNQIYICIPFHHPVLIKNLDGQTIQTISDFIQYPTGIEIDSKNSLIYISDMTHMTIFNLKIERISGWKLPVGIGWGFRGIHIVEKYVYVTMECVHQVFICNKDDGKVISRWGTEKAGSGKDQWNEPRGVVVENQNAYICDCNNFRVKILRNGQGRFVTQWGGTKGRELGQFRAPSSIYFFEEIFYIGDYSNIQLFCKDGHCEQRIEITQAGSMEGEFHWVGGICFLNDEMYVSDTFKNRIQIFRRLEDGHTEPMVPMAPLLT